MPFGEETVAEVGWFHGETEGTAVVLPGVAFFAIN
jgi:hypothetical protein